MSPGRARYLVLALAAMAASGCDDPMAPDRAEDDSVPFDDSCPIGSEGCACSYELQCNAGLVCSEFVCEPSGRCGNGEVEGQEQCDDGNDASGDGCSPMCTWDETVMDISAGADHTCAVLAGGRVKCWGNNADGQLGYPHLARIGDLKTPAEVGEVALGAPATAVGAGNGHSCALRVDGRVRCWGLGARGQLGLGASEPIGDDELPTSVDPVMLGDRARSIAVSGEGGGGRTCAVLDGGALRCWGSGDLGYPGPGPHGDDELPMALGDLAIERVASVAVAPGHICAVTRLEGLRCWGHNRFGELGYGDRERTFNPAERSEDVPVGFAVAEVSVSVEHTCARSTDGRIRCWGAGWDGRLGYGARDDVGGAESRRPRDMGDVRLGGSALQVVTGWSYSCALLEGGVVRCWGAMLGMPKRHAACPGHDDLLPECTADPACCVGDDEAPADVAPIDLGGPVRRLAAGAHHACAIMETGAVRCWGLGAKGRLGYGTSTDVGDDEAPAAAGDVPL